MYKVADEVKAIRNEIIKSILDDLKTKSYIRKETFCPEVGYEAYSFYNSWIFETKYGVVVFGKCFQLLSGVYFHNLSIIGLNMPTPIFNIFPSYNLKKFIKSITSTLDHELTHFFDHKRGMKFIIPIGLKNYYKNYYNSIHELNAYICSNVLEINNIQDFQKEYKNSECFRFLTDKNKKRVLKKAYQYYYE